MRNLLLIYSVFVILANTTVAQNVLHSCGADSVHNPNLTYGTVSDIDGNSYKTIAIGNQVWMAENLKTGRYLNGDLIPIISSNSDWINAYYTQADASCWYNNDSTNYDCPYGKLYNWHVVNDSRKVCPMGWNVPTDQEWLQLVNFIDPNGGGVNGGSTGGDLLKSTGLQYWLNNSSLVSNNATGFSGITTGLRVNDGIFSSFGLGAGFWTSTESPLENQVYYNVLRYDGAGIAYTYGPKETGLCIRCLSDTLLVTSIDFIEQDNFMIYPNPASTEINIQANNASIFQTEIFNAFGELVLSTQNQTNIDVSNLNTGIYFVKITGGNFTFNQKLIIQK
jgi:uncharacterized protein (TIGR02145 family)